MRITVRVKPNAKKTAVEKTANGEYIVRVQAPPLEGRANDAVIAALADHFGVPRSRVRIAHGLSGKSKIIDIAG